MENTEEIDLELPADVVIEEYYTPMDKRDFMIQFVLNRALSGTDGTYGESLSKQALEAWNYIERNTK